MRIKMLTPVSGDGWSAAIGDVIEIEDEVAERYVAKEMAELVESVDSDPDPNPDPGQKTDPDEKGSGEATGSKGDVEQAAGDREPAKKTARKATKKTTRKTTKKPTKKTARKS